MWTDIVNDSLLAGLSIDERRVVQEGYTEATEECTPTPTPGVLHSFEMMSTREPTRYTHVEGSGPAVVLRMFFDHGDFEPRTTVHMALSMEVLLAHFASTEYPTLLKSRMAMHEHNQAIDFLPMKPGEFRVYESRVHCTLQQQKYIPHPPPYTSAYSSSEEEEEEEKKEGSLEKDYPPSNKRKRVRRKKKGDDGPGLVFVRDAQTSMQLCGQCLCRVMVVGGSLGGKVKAGVNVLMGATARL